MGLERTFVSVINECLLEGTTISVINECCTRTDSHQGLINECVRERTVIIVTKKCRRKYSHQRDKRVLQNGQSSAFNKCCRMNNHQHLRSVVE